MGDGYSTFGVGDKGGRRSGEDRRRIVNPEYMIDRRSGYDRRNILDRRTGTRENVLDFRRDTDRYMEFANTQKGLALGIVLSVPVWALIIAKLF